MRRSIFLVLLLGLAVLPASHATGGVIHSVVISGDGDIGEGPVDVNLTFIGVGGAVSASVNWTASLTDFEGSPIDSKTGNVIVEDGALISVETSLNNAPLGYSNLTVTLTGDIGTPNSSQYISWSEVIHRLRPLDVSLSNPIYTAVDQAGIETGNLTIRDGDYSRIDVALRNDGDIPWNGSVNASIDSIAIPPIYANISGDSSQIISILTQKLSEGETPVVISLNGPNDLDSSDDILLFNLLIGPPPLADLEWNLSRNEEAIAGTEISWTIIVNNSGESIYDGEIYCNFNGEQFFSENHSIAKGSEITIVPSTIARPGTLSCHPESRTLSNNNVSDDLVISSAVFIGAGHSTPTILQGPWHVGDEIFMSMLLRNEGDSSGQANLQIEISDETSQGQNITLEKDGAGEVNHAFNFTTSGEKVVNWSIVSIDGGVDSNLSGQVLIPVLDAQLIDLDIDSSSNSDQGLEIDWSIELAEGRERLVILEYGTENSGIRTESLQEERVLLPGMTSGSLNLGESSSDKVYFTATLVDWNCAFLSDLDTEIDIPVYVVSPIITLENFTQPVIPEQGEDVTLFYSLEDAGDASIPAGHVVFTTRDGTVLSSIETEKIDNKKSFDTIVKWPDDDIVTITATWYAAGTSSTDSIEVDSQIGTIIDDEFKIPWGGILGGIALGVALIMGLRLKNGPSKEKKTKSEKKAVQEKPSQEEKVEVTCPSCDRRLKVPSTYSGAVRCPECEDRFEVEGIEEEQEIDDEIEEESPSDKEPEILWSSSGEDILECPKCSRSLKVPYDRRPAKARCPACEAIFEARKE